MGVRWKKFMTSTPLSLVWPRPGRPWADTLKSVQSNFGGSQASDAVARLVELRRTDRIAGLPPTNAERARWVPWQTFSVWAERKRPGSVLGVRPGNTPVIGELKCPTPSKNTQPTQPL